MAKAWISDARLAALGNAGRVRNTFDKAQRAREWNGNVEPVTVTTAGVKASPIPKTAAGKPVTSLYPLVTLCRMAKLPEPVPEFRFHPSRKWRFDYAWPMHMLALEVDGGVWTQGRHTRGKGAIADMEKASEAAILGWRMLYVVPADLDSGIALNRVERALAA